MLRLKARVLFVAVLAAVMVSLGCSSENMLSEKDEKVEPEIVDAVPDELFHWLNHELAVDRGARVFTTSHQGYTYYVASAGNQSVKNGEIDLVEKDLESGKWSVKFEYNHPGITERSSERHFAIIKVPEDVSISVSLAAMTGVEQ